MHTCNKSLFPSLRRASLTELLALCTLYCTLHSARADVRLPGVFGDNMVLQQDIAVPVWGWADDGEQVTVQFRDQSVSTVAKDGKWRVNLSRLRTGGPDTFTVAGRNRLEFSNVLVGEVWICSGQSNMEWPLSRSFESKEEIARSGNPVIRLFTVPKLKANEPTNNVHASWKLCGPETVPSFSAVAYYFGRDLQKALGVPIGLIHTSWGGSPAEVWMSQDVLAADPDFKKSILDAYPVAVKAYQDALARYEQEAASLAAEGKKPAGNKPSPPFWKPSELYNGMIAPLIPYAVRGAIWYQGESNAGRAFQYRALFTDLIRNWRRAWDRADLAFLEVQLAPWDKSKKRSMEQITAAPVESDWAELREAQLYASRILPKVGMAVITDVGDKDDIHPTKKEPVGARLALAARGIAYGEKIVYRGPAYKGMKIQGNKAVLTFDSIGRGLAVSPVAGVTQPQTRIEFNPDGKTLVSKDTDGTARVWDASTGHLLRTTGALTGFAVAGDDRKFVWANAEIRGKKVIVSSPEVPHPVAVRYGWSDYPVVNLCNQNGLPASPFRTDRFPMLTEPKPQLASAATK